MKKVLFIDRDGTIIVEPIEDEQVDSLEKLEFLPGAISNLRKIAENELDSLGDTSTLAEPAVVDDLVENRMNR